MPSIFRPILLCLLLSVPLLAAEDQWIPERVPATGAVPFILYYQQFLRAHPFAIDHRKNTPEQHVKNRRNHQRAAALYFAMSKIALQLAQSEELLPAAPDGIKKDKKQKIGGSWNLYQNVPINAADLREEGLCMYFSALTHEASLDRNKIGAMHDFAVGLEENTKPFSLFQHTNRYVCLHTLALALKPLKDHADNPEKPLPLESELAKNISQAIEWFVPFVQKFPNEENIKQVDTFFDAVELFRANFPDSANVQAWITSFHHAFVAIQEQHVDSFLMEYAGTYDGMRRRWELLGKPMPIWGADLSGKIIDDKALEGKVVLLDFWATWCGPCLAEVPHLKLLYQKYKDKGFEIVGYSVDADQEVLREYLEKHPVPWIMLSKEATAQAGLPPLSLHYGAKSLPVVLLRDRSGNAVLLDARGEKLDEMLESLFD
jgi:thiol-disulfide isomerase/thioredoxin